MIPIPSTAIQQHTLVLGKTRSGKSSTMRVLVEYLLDQQKPVCIIDPKGDWWGLKSSADGKRAGYPVVIFGGEHADVPLNAHSGGAVAELVATGNRPCIIDLGGWMVGERTRFFMDFASSLFKHTRGARWLVIDECHNFAPQGRMLDPDSAKMLHWANRIASEGAGKGVTLISASQRPQKVHKDYVTSHETLIAKRVIHPLDRNAVKEWIDGCGDPDRGKEVIASLASMKREQGWVWSPEIGFGPKLIHFPMFITYDSFAASGHHTKNLKGWAAVDLDEVRTKLASAVQAAKDNDPKLLRAEIARLKAANPKPDEAAIKLALQEASAQASARARVLGGEIAGSVRAVENSISALKDHVDALLKWAKGEEKNTPSYVIVPPKPRQLAKAVSAQLSGQLPKGELAVLKALAQHNGCRREQLTVLTGYKRSSRDTYIQRLREKGFVDTSADRIAPTAAGVAALGDGFEPLPTGEALRFHVMQTLPEGEAKILGILISKYPSEIAKEDIDQETNYKRSSRDAYLQRLSARELVEFVSGGVRASETLFG